MTSLCLDTSAYSAFKRGDPAITKLLEQADSIALPTVVLGELHAGFAAGNRRAANEQELAQFLKLPGCEVAAITAQTARRYADVVVVLRANGTPIPTNDIWIAAVALETGSALVTRDRHFAQVPLLAVAPDDSDPLR